MRTFKAQRGNNVLMMTCVPTLTAMTVALAFFALSGSAQASTVPVIDSESVSHVTPTDATLEAAIEPRAWDGAYAQFQLVKDPSEYPSEILCPATPHPGTDGCIGSHSESALPIAWVCGSCEQEATTRPVSLDLASAGVTLQPGTTYHYRVIAARAVQTEDTIEWEPPTVYGPDQTFTTPPAKAPTIEGESVSHLTSTDATLEAQINSEGLETSYQFRLESGCLWPRECEAIAVYPMPSGELLGSFVDQSVSLDLNSTGLTLGPGVEYAYSVTATNAAGSVTGHEQRFTTPEDGVHPLNTATSPGPQPTTGPAQNTGQSPPPPPPVKRLVCKKGSHKTKVHGKTVCKKAPKHRKRTSKKK